MDDSLLQNRNKPITDFREDLDSLGLWNGRSLLDESPQVAAIAALLNQIIIIG